ncbi:MAG: hypothetical protein FWF76_06930 [Oscillospiraceae bacterium]|nr:hypothetical protein [Oscillospiraceae bacterium]
MRNMKKIIAISSCAALMLAFAACNETPDDSGTEDSNVGVGANDDNGANGPTNGGNGTDGGGIAHESDSTEEILQTVMDTAREELGDEGIPMSWVEEVTDNFENAVGLTAQQVVTYTESVYNAQALIGAFAFQVALIQANDVEAAEAVQSAIADGYNPAKWICVIPHKAVVIQNENYVLLIAAQTVEQSDVITNIFGEIMDGENNVNVFFEFDPDNPPEGYDPDAEGDGMGMGFGGGMDIGGGLDIGNGEIENID